MGVHRSTYYRWKAQVDRQGLEMLRPRERRRPQMPNQLSADGRAADRRVLRSAIPGSARGGSRRGWPAPNGAGWSFSPNGVYKTLRPARAQHARQAPGAGRRLPRPLRAAARARARAAHRQPPAGRAGRDRLLLRRPPARQPRARSGRSPRSTPTARSPGPIWSSARRRGPTVEHTSALARRVARELQAAGWRLERVLSDNGNEFGRHAFASRLPAGVRHTPDPRRAPADQRPRRTPAPHDPRRVLATRRSRATCMSASPASRRHLAHYLHDYNFDREHHGRITAGRLPRRPRLRCPQDGAQMSRTCRHNSESVQPSLDPPMTRGCLGVVGAVRRSAEHPQVFPSGSADRSWR